MSIKVGDKIPAATFKIMGEQGPRDISTSEIFDGKKVAFFAVPGAFTPGCSATHLPGFIIYADKIKAKGVDSIVCVAVNDAFVMDAWKKSQNAEEIDFIADGNGTFTKAIGMELDGSGFGLGQRSKRYAMIVDNGVVKYLGLDDKGIEKSAAEAVLEQL
jgi:peroxiredoxin